LSSSSEAVKRIYSRYRELTIEGLVSTSLVVKKEGENLGELITVLLGLRNCVTEVPISIISVEALLTGSTSVSFYVE